MTYYDACDEAHAHSGSDNYCPMWADELVSCEDCIYCDTKQCEMILRGKRNGKEKGSNLKCRF